MKKLSKEEKAVIKAMIKLHIANGWGIDKLPYQLSRDIFDNMNGSHRELVEDFVKETYEKELH